MKKKLNSEIFVRKESKSIKTVLNWRMPIELPTCSTSHCLLLTNVLCPTGPPITGLVPFPSKSSCVSDTMSPVLRYKHSSPWRNRCSWLVWNNERIKLYTRLVQSSKYQLNKMVAETAATHINMHGLMHTLSPFLNYFFHLLPPPPPPPPTQTKKKKKRKICLWQVKIFITDNNNKDFSW